MIYPQATFLFFFAVALAAVRMKKRTNILFKERGLIGGRPVERETEKKEKQSAQCTAERTTQQE